MARRGRNYWGHNALIRTRAFAEAAGLPVLPGRKPFGGPIMSHDFVEAALIRRAGWAVHMMPALQGSFEGKPTLLECTSDAGQQVQPADPIQTACRQDCHML